MTRRRRDDRGSAAVQLPVVAGVFILFAVLLVFAGRVNSSHAAVQAAARYGARSISINRDSDAAIDLARTEAEDTVGLGSAKCAEMDFAHQILPDRVSVTVTCTVDLSDVDLFGMPGSWSVTATAEEPLDVWRETGSGA